MAEEHATRARWLARVDELLGTLSRDRMWRGMWDELQAVIRQKQDNHSVGAAQSGATHQAVRYEHVECIFDYQIVGAGFAGSILAARLAAGAGKRVLILDRRSHIGGNANDCHDDAGILIHRYGPHIFHTNSREVWDYRTRFTEWRRTSNGCAPAWTGSCSSFPST